MIFWHPCQGFQMWTIQPQRLAPLCRTTASSCRYNTRPAATDFQPAKAGFASLAAPALSLDEVVFDRRRAKNRKD
ncbi:MAG: hypothetical protein Fur0018_02600 [Anaerolineales bacterium]